MKHQRDMAEKLEKESPKFEKPEVEDRKLKSKIPKEYLEFPESIIPRAVLGSAIQFLQLVESVLKETTKRNNSNWYFGTPLSDAKIEKRMQWSDFNLIRPVLFSYYHGLELLMKALLLTLGKSVKADHKLNKLIEMINSSGSIPKEIKKALSAYLDDKVLIEPMKTFMKQNDIDISELYSYLRYPVDRYMSKFPNYDIFEYQGEKLLPYLKSITRDSRFLRIKSLEFFRKKAKIKKLS